MISGSSVDLPARFTLSYPNAPPASAAPRANHLYWCDRCGVAALHEYGLQGSLACAAPGHHVGEPTLMRYLGEVGVDRLKSPDKGTDRLFR